MKEFRKIFKQFPFFVVMLSFAFCFSACSDDDDGDGGGGGGTTETGDSYVSANQTDWSQPISESFEYSMTYVTQLAFDGTECKNLNAEIAAFVGNECRGTTKLVYEEDLDIYICYLTIYSNSSLGEKLTIKVFNPEAKKLFDKKEEINFQSNASIGDIDKILDCIAL